MVSKAEPTVSVVIPCYNEEGSIAVCLDALIFQREFIDEILVVDNNSADSTVPIVENYCAKYAFIRLLSEEKQGVQFARNHGFDAAKNHIIGRIDADTRIDPGWAEALLNYYSQPDNKDIGVASGSIYYYDLPFQKITNFFANIFVFDMNKKSSTTHPPLIGANMSIKKQAWQSIRDTVCMDPGIMEDMDVGFHSGRAGFKVGYSSSAKAGISGRRMRMSPLRFWKYNRECWMTYYRHGYYKDARKIKLFVMFGNAMQVIAWLVLLFYDPKTNKFRLIPNAERQERPIP